MWIENKEITISGNIIKMARIAPECYDDIDNPKRLIEALKRTNVKADILTFFQWPPDTKPKYDYYMEWFGIAVIPIKNYEYWWQKQIRSIIPPALSPPLVALGGSLYALAAKSAKAIQATPPDPPK